MPAGAGNTVRATEKKSLFKGVWSHRHRELCGKTRTGALRGIRTPLLDGRARHAARLRQRTPCQIGRERFLPNPAQVNYT
jgi:hypothetical protein